MIDQDVAESIIPESQSIGRGSRMPQDERLQNLEDRGRLPITMNTRTSATRISAKGATKTRARRSQSQTVQLPAGLGEASSALPEKPRVQSAARTIGILLAIARSREGLQVKEISTALKLPRQVTYHLLHTLSATGVIRKRHENRYVLGLAAAIIAEGFRRQLGPPEQLAQKVREVAAKCGETAYASGWVDGEIVVLASARGHSAVHAAEVSQGHSEDAHARASGKLLLALADPMTCEAYLSRHRLSARTRNTMTSIRKLTAAFEEIRNNGYSVDKEEFAEGLCCLAVPLEVAGGQIVLSISVPADRFEGNLNRYLTALRAQARLGYDE